MIMIMIMIMILFFVLIVLKIVGKHIVARTMTTGPNTRGLFVTFEGIDGSGKSTIMRLVAEKYRNEARVYHDPGGTSFGEDARALIFAARKLSAWTEALIFAAARYQLSYEHIIPDLDNGLLVLCDRYIDSSLIYQGYAQCDLCTRAHRESDPISACQSIRAICSINSHPNLAIPHLTILLDAQVTTCMERMAARACCGIALNRFDEASTDHFERIREGYAKLARDSGGRIVTIDAMQPIDQIVSNVIGLIEKMKKKI
ncbi:MAG: dTMP kinase [Candidatus Paceibacterota bacterium]|jgi:dTMP kinase